MEPILLRDYQTAAVQGVYDRILEGHNAPLIAAPTGVGKSLMLAGLIQRTCREYPKTRHLVLTHVKELIIQDVKALQTLWPNAPMGIYSAALRRRDSLQPIILAGNASIRNRADIFGHRDFAIIDEVHMLSPTAETTYQKIIGKLREINPNLIVVGLTATPYRRGIGSLLNGGILDSMAIDLTTPEWWKWFIANGYLTPLHAKCPTAKIDVSGVAISNGDYAEGQLQAASDQAGLNEAIAREIAIAARTRKAALVFCAGVEHSEHMAQALTAAGVPTQAVHSKLTDEERDARIAAFKSGRIKALTNNNVLTAGFDHPPIDLIGMCRATVSEGLWVQMLGRGTRPAPGKNDALVLDFVGNRPRLGPVDAPYVPDPKKKGPTGELPVKVCDNCGCYAHISARVCEACEVPFPIATKLKQRPGTDEIMSEGTPIIETFPVSRVTYARHSRKVDGAVSVRVDYACGARLFSEWINFDKNSHKAHEFWRQRVGDGIPSTNDEALSELSKGVAMTPKRLAVWTNRKYPEIVRCEFN